MKILRVYYLFIVIFLSLAFFSCSNTITNSTVSVGLGSTNMTTYYNWEVTENANLGDVTKMSAGSENIIFMAGSNGYIYNRGVKTVINFQDDTFKPYDVKAYDSTYAIFLGKSAATNNQVIKIYDNGVVATFVAPHTNTYLHNLVGLLIESKYKFYVASQVQSGSSDYFVFNNGVLKDYDLTDYQTPYLFAKVNNDVYMFSFKQSTTLAFIYKMNGGNADKVYSENYPVTPYFMTALDNGLLQSQTSIGSTSFRYFTGSKFLDAGYAYGPDVFARTFGESGVSQSFFTFTRVNNSKLTLNISVNKNIYYQSNFPEVTGDIVSRNELVCTYKDKAYFIIYSNGSKLAIGKNAK